MENIVGSFQNSFSKQCFPKIFQTLENVTFDRASPLLALVQANRHEELCWHRLFLCVYRAQSMEETNEQNKDCYYYIIHNANDPVHASAQFRSIVSLQSCSRHHNHPGRNVLRVTPGPPACLPLKGGIIGVDFSAAQTHVRVQT